VKFTSINIKRVFPQAKWMNKSESMDIAWIGIYRIAILKKLGVKQSRKFGEIHFYYVDKDFKNIRYHSTCNTPPPPLIYATVPSSIMFKSKCKNVP